MTTDLVFTALAVAGVAAVAWALGRFGLRQALYRISYLLTPEDVKRSIQAVLSSSDFWREEAGRLSGEFGFGGSPDGLVSGLVEAYAADRLREEAATSKSLNESDFEDSTDPGYRRLSPTFYAGIEDVESKREDARQASRYYAIHDPLYKRALGLVVKYTWGRGVVGPKAKDREVQKVLDQFKADQANELITTVFGQWAMSSALLQDGEFFPTAYVNKVNGRVEISFVEPDEIKAVVVDEKNKRRPRYYKRTYSPCSFDYSAMEYKSAGLKTEIWPDWGCEELTPGSRERFYECSQCGSEVNLFGPSCPKCGVSLREAGSAPVLSSGYRTGTEKATVGNGFVGQYMHQYSTNSRSSRGLPPFYAAIPYVKSYKGYIQDRIVLLIALATFAFKSKVKGSKVALRRVVEDWGSKVLSRWGGGGVGTDQERASGGRVMVENDAMTTEQFRVDTGASNAMTDARIQRQQVSAAVDITEPDLTGDASVGNLASITAMDGPQLKGFEWWQTLFKQILSDCYSLAIRAAIKYGGLSPIVFDVEQGKYVDRDLSFEIDFPPIVAKDLPQFVGAVSALIAAQTTSGSTFISPTRIAKYLLQAFGEEDLDAALEEVLFSSEPRAGAAVQGQPVPDQQQKGTPNNLPDSVADSVEALRDQVARVAGFMQDEGIDSASLKAMLREAKGRRGDAL